jgi:hypothetical protein
MFTFSRDKTLREHEADVVSLEVETSAIHDNTMPTNKMRKESVINPEAAYVKHFKCQS